MRFVAGCLCLAFGGLFLILGDLAHSTLRDRETTKASEIGALICMVGALGALIGMVVSELFSGP